MTIHRRQIIGRLRIWCRAFRLPFLGTSLLPFAAGSAFQVDHIAIVPLSLGLAVVGLTHISANLINDYADSRSGVDWKDSTYYGLFGGSKLIQAGVLGEPLYLRAEVASAVAAVAGVGSLTVLSGLWMTPVYFAAVLALAWAYSCPPFRLSYHRLGELTILLLFGPALVMGGHYLQTGAFPARDSFRFSLPFGLLTAGILIVNEVPDHDDDVSAGKFTLVTLVGKRRTGFLYGLTAGAALAMAVWNHQLPGLSKLTLSVVLAAVPAAGAAVILARCPCQKSRLLNASRLAIVTQLVATLGLLAGVLW